MALADILAMAQVALLAMALALLAMVIALLAMVLAARGPRHEGVVFPAQAAGARRAPQAARGLVARNAWFHISFSAMDADLARLSRELEEAGHQLQRSSLK